MSETDKDPWKRRFLFFMAARLFGLATFLSGVAIMFTDLLRPGGWPMIGTFFIILGLIDAVGAPLMMKRRWDKEDRAGRPQ